MRKQNQKYEKFRKIVGCFCDGGMEATEEELDLMHQLDSIMSFDKGMKIAEYVVSNDSKINDLLDVIDQMIDSYNDSISQLQDIDSSKRSKYLSKLNQLKILKNDVIKYSNRQVVNQDRSLNDFIDLCVSSLAVNYFTLPKYFGQPIAKKNPNSYRNGEVNFIVNWDIVDGLYDALEDEKVVKALQDGVDIINEKNKKIDIIKSCDEVLSYKEAMYENIDRVIDYNVLSRKIDELHDEKRNVKYAGIGRKLREINLQIEGLSYNKIARLIHSKELDLLEKRKKELEELALEKKRLDNDSSYLQEQLATVQTDLIQSDIKDLLFKVNVKLLLNLRKEEYSLENRISSIESLDDLDKFYEEVEVLRNTNVDILQNELLPKRDKYIDNTSEEIVKFINDDFETASNIVSLSRAENRNGISPALALFALKSISIMNDTNLNDISITEEEYDSIKKYYNRLMESGYERYSSQFRNILDKNMEKQYIKI